MSIDLLKFVGKGYVLDGTPLADIAYDVIKQYSPKPPSDGVPDPKFVSELVLRIDEDRKPFLGLYIYGEGWDDAAKDAVSGARFSYDPNSDTLKLDEPIELSDGWWISSIVVHKIKEKEKPAVWRDDLTWTNDAVHDDVSTFYTWR